MSRIVRPTNNDRPADRRLLAAKPAEPAPPATGHPHPNATALLGRANSYAMDAVARQRRAVR